jgi:hypothetical protein
MNSLAMFYNDVTGKLLLNVLKLQKQWYSSYYLLLLTKFNRKVDYSLIC